MSQMIIPRYNVVLTYDIAPDQEEEYYRFVLGEFVPGLQGLGLYLIRAWHTVYGDYPVRQSEFVAQDMDTIRRVFNSEEFRNLEARLFDFVTNYDRKVVAFNQSFNLVTNN